MKKMASIQPALACERLFRDLATMAGPRFYPVVLEERSFPEVNCSFSNAIFTLNYGQHEDRDGRVRHCNQPIVQHPLIE